MDMQDRLSTIAGAFYGVFFYIKLVYGDWDMLVLWAGNIAIIVGLIFGYIQYKRDVLHAVGDGGKK